MSKRALLGIGALLLVAAYVLCQFGLPLWAETLPDQRALCNVWAFAAVVALGFACGTLSAGRRAIAGATVGAGVIVFIPVWSNSGCWASDLNGGVLTGALAAVLGGAAAHYGPTLATRVAVRRVSWLKLVVASLVVLLPATACFALPPFPRSALDTVGAQSPTVAGRWLDTGSFIAELRLKPWVRSGGTYYGEIALGERDLVQIISGGRLRRIAFDGSELATPSLPSLQLPGDNWFTLQRGGDLLLLGGPLSVMARVSTAQVVAVTAPAEADLRAVALSDDTLYLAGWATVRALASDGREIWVYQRPSRPVVYSEVRFRAEYNLSNHPGQKGAGFSGPYLSVVPGGPVVAFDTGITAFTEDGRVRWQRLTDGRILAITAPATGARVLSLEMCPLPGESGLSTGVVRAYDSDTGAPVWEWAVPEDVVALDWLADEETLLLSLTRRSGDAIADSIVAFDRDGRELWTLSDADRSLGPIITSLTLVDGGYLVTAWEKAVCLDRTTGAVRYTLSPDADTRPPNGFDNQRVTKWGDTLVMVAGRRVYGIDPATGARRWTFFDPYGVTGLSAFGDHLAIGSSRGVTLLQRP